MTEKRAFAALHAYFGYRDAPAALVWLERAFGFETTTSYPDERGGIMHAELRRDEISFTLFSDDDGYEHPAAKGETVGHGLYISVVDSGEVDAVFARAVGAGAVPVWEPAMSPWGNYRCRVRDPEGYEWTFGTHVPGQPQQDWSE